MNLGEMPKGLAMNNYVIELKKVGFNFLGKGKEFRYTVFKK